MRKLALLTFLFVTALLFPGSAGAHLHLQLRSSDPAHGDTVDIPLQEVRVVFSQAVNLPFTTLTLIDATGAALAHGAEPTDSSLTSFVLRLPAALHRGEYTTRWRTAGADGHVVEGSFTFVVAADGAEPVAQTAAPASPSQTTVTPDAPRDPYTSAAWVATRFVTFASIVLVIGSLTFLVILSHAQRMAPGHDEFWAKGALRTRQLAIGAGAVAFLAAIPRLLLQSSALHGNQLAFDTAFLASLLETSWGRGWTLQAGAALTFCLAWLTLRPARNAVGWMICAGAAVALAASPALSGHAAAVAGRPVLPIVLDAAHVFGASAWIGSLAALLVIALPLAVRSGNHDALAVTVATFSPMALFGAAVAAFTGVAGAIFHIPSLDQLFTTSYGQTVLFKFAAVVVVLALGAFNWRRVRPRLGNAAGSATLRRSATTEFLLAIFVLLITAVLVALPTPV